VRVFDLHQRLQELKELETDSERPDLWDDAQHAQSVMQKLSATRAFIEPFQSLDQRAADLIELIELADLEGDADLADGIDTDLSKLHDDYRSFERTLLFAGEYDGSNAIFSVNAGAGGTEAQDWAQILLRAYLRWAQRHKFSV
jgi:peptide chain release factor 2